MVIQKIKGNLNFQQVTNVNKVVEQTYISNSNKQNLLEKQPNTNTFEKTKEKMPPQACEISKLRLATSFLTDEQITEINTTGKLPDNAKFIFDGEICRYYIANNFFGIRAGTQTLPAGFEVKKNIIGQAIVVPKNTNGILIK